MPPVITISAPYGAGGSVVGPALAQRLDVPFLDRAIPVEVSSRLQIPVDDAIGLDELPRAGLSRWMAAFAPAVQMVGGSFADVTSLPDEIAFRDETEAVLRDHARGGAVILGRAGAIVLRDLPAALHVRLHGPLERRIRQATRLLGVDQDTARQQLQASDLAREAYVRHGYQVEPSDPSHYHLVLDSTQITLDGCVELIERALQHRMPSGALGNSSR